MNVFRYEFKSNIKATFLWGISLGLVGFLFIIAYPAFMKDIESLNSMLALYPPELLKALGLGENGLNTFHGFYSFCIIYPILCGAIQALIMGVQVISKEGARKTSDFLFTKPINRIHILSGKYAAVLLCIFITSGIYFILTLMACLFFVEEMNYNIFFLMTGAFLLTQIVFLAMGFCIGCFVKKVKSPTTVGIGLGSMFFLLEMLDNMYDDMKIHLLSPMSYLKPSFIAENHTYDMKMLIVLFLLTVIFTVCGFIRYKTKDIHSA